MKAIVTVPFRGVPDGEHHPQFFNVGDELAGDLAAVALTEGWARREGVLEHAVAGPLQTQALGGAPEPFRESAKPAGRRRRERA